MRIFRHIRPAHASNFCRCSKANGKLASESGATMLEMAIIAPIFFLLLFGFIDIARYWQAKAAVSEAAQEGVNKLVVDPRLKQGPAEIVAAKAAIKTEVEARAEALILQRVGNAEAIIVTPNVSAYETIPVDVTATVRFDPLLPIIWSSEIRISTRASGYIEPLKKTSEPIPTDCHGNLYDLFTPPGAPPYNTLCPCDKGDLSFTNSQGVCVCSGDIDAYPQVRDGTLLSDGSCGCGPDKKPIVGFDWTAIGAILHWDDDRIKTANASSTVCCDADTPEACPADQLRLNNMAMGLYECGCWCGPSAKPDTGAGGKCKCDNENENYVKSPYGTSYCVCSLHTGDCHSSAEIDYQACACKCPAPKVYDKETGCGCKDGADTTCTDSGGTFDTNTCSCQCSGTRKGTGDNTACVCNVVQATSDCDYSGGTFDEDTCSCNCSDGFGAAVDGFCTCPGGYHPPQDYGYEDQQCYCYGHASWEQSSRTCKCPDSLEASCAEGKGTFNREYCTCQCLTKSSYFNTATDKCECYPAYKNYCEGVYAGFAKGSFDNDTCNCSCPEHSSSFYGIFCLCAGGARLVGGKCECPSGFTWSNTTNKCECDKSTDTAQKCISSGGDLDPVSCQCAICKKDLEIKAGACVCKAPKISDGGTGCMCDPNSTPAVNCKDSGGTPDKNCNCSGCDGLGKVRDASNACVCDSDKGQTEAPDESCMCNLSSGFAKACKDSGGTPDAKTCSCACGNAKMKADSKTNVCLCQAADKTACESSGGIFDPKTCACNCGAANLNGNACVCANGAVLSGGACGCGDLRKEDASGKCACDPAAPAVKACTDTKGTVNPSTCACACNFAGQTFSAANGCKCADGKSPNTDTAKCECDNTDSLEMKACRQEKGVVDPTSCQCDCPGMASWNGSECTCPDGMKFDKNVGCKCDSFQGYDYTGPDNGTCVRKPCAAYEKNGICYPSKCRARGCVLNLTKPKCTSCISS